jgi:hypothetical protein
MAKKAPYVIIQDGYWLEWFTRRAELDVDVYRLGPGRTRGELVSELSYPKISGIGFSDFTAEAVSIARQKDGAQSA